MPLIPGTRLGAYEIVAPLGAGGMGEVYRARDTKLGREVAIKVLTTESLHDDGARARLLREAQLAATLNHSNICTVHEVGEADGPSISRWS
jgi:serine/threonine protein kinase